MAFTDTVPSVAKAMPPFLHASLLDPLTREEKLGIEVLKPRNARQVLGIDVYEAKGLCKTFSIETFFELCELYRERREEYEYSTASESVEPASSAFQKDLKRALFAEAKSSNILRLLEYLVSEALMLSEAREELRREIELVEKEQERLEAEAMATDAALKSSGGNETAAAAVAAATTATAASAAAATIETGDVALDTTKAAEREEEERARAASESKQSDHDTVKVDYEQKQEQRDGESKVGCRATNGGEAEASAGMENEEGKEEEEKEAEEEEEEEEQGEAQGGEHEEKRGEEMEKASGQGAKVMSLAETALSHRTASQHPSAVLYAKECEKYGIPVSAIFTKCVESASVELNFSHYGLSHEGLSAITTALGKYDRLHSLNLADNWIDAEGAATVCTYLVDSTLVALDLGKNNVGLVCVRTEREGEREGEREPETEREREREKEGERKIEKAALQSPHTTPTQTTGRNRVRRRSCDQDEAPENPLGRGERA